MSEGTQVKQYVNDAETVFLEAFGTVNSAVNSAVDSAANSAANADTEGQARDTTSMKCWLSSSVIDAIFTFRLYLKGIKR